MSEKAKEAVGNEEKRNPAKGGPGDISSINQLMIVIIACIGLGGVTSLLATYFFLAKAGTMIINSRVDERIKEIDTADRIFVLQRSVPAASFAFRPLGKPVKYMLIRNAKGSIVAIHVTFKTGQQACVAEIGAKGRENVTVVFSRGDGPMLIKLGELVPTGPEPETVEPRLERY